MKQATLTWPIASTLIVSLLGAPAGLAAEPAPAATILEVTGPVSWKAPEAADFVPARGGEALRVGAIVRTGARGQARLRWQNGGDFRLMPFSEIKVADPDAVETRSGRIWGQFKDKLLRPFFFRSPSATAVVRGTTLSFGVDAEGATRVVVSEGKVEVFGREGRTLFVTGGQAVKAAPDGRLGQVEPMGSNEQPPFEGGAAPGSSAPVAMPAPERKPERSERPSEARSWARLDDWTRRGLDWLDRHRASERMPQLRQEMTIRTRPAVHEPAPGEHPQAQAPEDRTGVSAGLTPAGGTAAPPGGMPEVPVERPGDAWPKAPPAKSGGTPAQRPGDAWPQTPPSSSQPDTSAERPGDPWPKAPAESPADKPARDHGPPECTNRPLDGTGQHSDLPECGQDEPHRPPKDPRPPAVK